MSYGLELFAEQEYWRVEAEAVGWKAAFRHRETGEIIVMPSFHDITALPGAGGEWDESVYKVWEDGFVNPRGEFFNRTETWDQIEVMDSMVLPHNWPRADQLHKEIMEKQSRRPIRKG